MRWVPDSVPLTLLSFPGTHDTMAFYGGPIAKTQSMPLYDQLRAGIRTLDIRARHDKDRFEIYHGIAYQNASFGDVLASCNAFLAQNPTETILLELSDAGVPAEKDCTRSYRETFEWYRDISLFGGRIFKTNDFGSFTIPLGQVRGKIVIIENFPQGSDCNTCGLESKAIYQNLSGEVNTTFEIPAKWAAIVEQCLSIANGLTERMYENSTSGGGGGVWPIDLANGVGGYEGLNYRYLKYLFYGNQNRTTGLMYMDFPGSGAIAAIIAHNMRFATNLSAMGSDFARVLADLSPSAVHEGEDGSADHAVQLKAFLNHILPDQHWSVLVSANFGFDTGFSLEPEGMFAQAVTGEGYSHVAVSSRNLDAAITPSQITDFLTPGRLEPLSGLPLVRAQGVRNLLKAQFPQARWNVAVRRAPFDAGNWSAQITAAASATVSVLDDGSFYLYTAWATSASNRAPIIVANSQIEVNEGEPFTLDVSQSNDPDGDTLQYRWDLNGDQTWDTDYLYEPSIIHVFPDNGIKAVFVEAFDGASAISTKISVSVLNVTPSLQTSGPLSTGEGLKLKQEFTIKDTSADTWRVEVAFGDGSPMFQTNVTTATFSLEHQFPTPGYFPLQITVRDDDGATGTATLHTVVGAPKLTIHPAGETMLQLAWTNHPAPFRLETSSHLTTSEWHEVTEPPLLLDGFKTLNLTATNSQQSFRLVLP
jgi:1-phosphatidylinositol phosphodiesterase